MCVCVYLGGEAGGTLSRFSYKSLICDDSFARQTTFVYQ